MEVSPQLPNILFSNTNFTWVGNRLNKVVTDTMGVFESSVDFFYTTAGANTIITTKETPSNDVIQPDYSYKLKRILTVDANFSPIKEEFNSHTYVFQGGIPENYHDSAYITYNYTSNDLTSIIYASSRHDTSGAGGSIKNINRDTATNVYNRNSSGNNITDSLKKIFGKEVYTMMNFDLLQLYPIFPIYGLQLKYYYYFRPLTSIIASKKVWVNGVFNAGSSYNNVQIKKIINSFDTQQRLTVSEVYQDFINIDKEFILKVTY